MSPFQKKIEELRVKGNQKAAKLARSIIKDLTYLAEGGELNLEQGSGGFSTNTILNFQRLADEVTISATLFAALEIYKEPINEKHN